MKRTYRIEMNKVDYEFHHYWYLKADETITDVPSDALEFNSYDECENYRKEHDYANSFHTQSMISGD